MSACAALISACDEYGNAAPKRADARRNGRATIHGGSHANTITEPAKCRNRSERGCPRCNLFDAGRRSGATEERQNRRHRAAVGSLGAAGLAGKIRRRDGRQRNQRGRRYQGARRRQARTGRDRRWRFGREGEERRAAARRAGIRRSRRHGRVALHVHARRNRSDRARADPLADAVLFRHDHRPRVQICVPVVADRRPAINRSGADHPESRQDRDRQGPPRPRASSATIRPHRSASSSPCARAFLPRWASRS